MISVFGNVKCSKCGSTDVTVERRDNPLDEKKQKPTTMDELARRSGHEGVTLEYIYTLYEAVCQDCGYKVSWSE